MNITRCGTASSLPKLEQDRSFHPRPLNPLFRIPRFENEKKKASTRLAPVSRFMFLMLAVSSSSKRARGASNFNSEILPAMSLIIEPSTALRGNAAGNIEMRLRPRLSAPCTILRQKSSLGSKSDRRAHSARARFRNWTLFSTLAFHWTSSPRRRHESRLKVPFHVASTIFVCPSWRNKKNPKKSLFRNSVFLFIFKLFLNFIYFCRLSFGVETYMAGWYNWLKVWVWFFVAFLVFGFWYFEQRARIRKWRLRRDSTNHRAGEMAVEDLKSF